MAFFGFGKKKKEEAAVQAAPSVVEAVQPQPDHQRPDKIQSCQRQNKIHNTHTRSSVGAGTSFRRPATKVSPVAW